MRAASFEDFAFCRTSSITAFKNWAINQLNNGARKTGFLKSCIKVLVPSLFILKVIFRVDRIFVKLHYLNAIIFTNIFFFPVKKLYYVADMKRVFRHLIWLIKGIQVFALIGKSGTGKSFRAKLVSSKYGIDLIIDDGLLIENERIIAGKSAKKDKAYLSAIKTAVFDDPVHRKEVRDTLKKTRFKRVLLIGTSEKMVVKIAKRLGLPGLSRIIRIEDIATEAEIEEAIKSRKTEGKHIIPVPSIEIARKYSHILYDSVKIFFRRKLNPFTKKDMFEKTVVRPYYSRRGEVSVSEAALIQMVHHCVAEFDNTVSIRRVTVNYSEDGYRLKVFIQIPLGEKIQGNLHGLQNFIIESLERFTGVSINKVHIIIDHFKSR